MGISQTLKAPVAYQGGKSRLASAIVDIIYDANKDHYYDLCCGSGAVSIELIKRGVSPSQIHMVDQGPWGLFWKNIGENNFDKIIFQKIINKIPKDPTKIQDYVKQLSQQPVSEDQCYIFLILQAASFGSKPIWNDDKRWKNCSFRSYWKPTPTSKRRSPVNPMMPMPETLYNRVISIADVMAGVNGYHQDIHSVKILPNSVVYIDPPYEGRTSYGYHCDAQAIASSSNELCYISEGAPLSNEAIKLSQGRSKGGVSGTRTRSPNEEWLNIYKSQAS